MTTEYLNTGSIDKSEGDRIVPITDLLIYGHGKPGVMMLGKADLMASYLEKQLNGAAFNNTKTVLYTCRAVNPDDNGYSVAKSIFNITHGETKAMNGKVDYAYIAYTKEEIESKKGWKEELLGLGTVYLSLKTRSINLLEYGEYDELENALEERMWEIIQSKLRDDEIKALRKERGYMQDGARYDPIPGKQAQFGSEEKRDPAFWETLKPGNS